MRECTRCKDSKKETDFSWRNKMLGKRHTYCKSCQNKLSTKHYANNKSEYVSRALRHRDLNKLKLLEYLKVHPCTDCAESDPVVLEFDHVSNNKLTEVSRMLGNGISWPKVLKEIDKCEVVCSNCHKRRTYSRLSKCYRYAGVA
jgi:hypothetical protein